MPLAISGRMRHTAGVAPVTFSESPLGETGARKGVMSALFHPSRLVGFGASEAEVALVAAALDGNADASAAREILIRVEVGTGTDLSSGRWMTPERRAADEYVVREAHAERDALVDQTPGMLAELKAAYPPVTRNA